LKLGRENSTSDATNAPIGRLVKFQVNGALVVAVARPEVEKLLKSLLRPDSTFNFHI
jgi:hypothetical protein